MLVVIFWCVREKHLVPLQVCTVEVKTDTTIPILDVKSRVCPIIEKLHTVLSNLILFSI